MSVRYLFVCDGCGKTAPGVGPHPENYVHDAPPMGWTWNWSPGLQGPHACGPECWAKVERGEDGRLFLPETHQTLAKDWATKSRERAPVQPLVIPEMPQRPKPGRKVKPGSITDLDRRLSAIETTLAPREATS
jgi:hypothetical protein